MFFQFNFYVILMSDSPRQKYSPSLSLLSLGPSELPRNESKNYLKLSKAVKQHFSQIHDRSSTGPFLFSLRSPCKTETIYPISWRKPRFTKVAICKIIELVKRCCCYKQANLVTFKVNLFNWISSCSISYLLLF